MKRASLFLAAALLLGAPATTLQSQDADPVPAPALAPPAPIAPVQKGTPLEMLKAMGTTGWRFVISQVSSSGPSPNSQLN